MSTHSYIGIENYDGSVTFAYCHYDGYVDGVGKQLLEYTSSQIAPIIERGEMRTIGDTFVDACPPSTVKDIDAFCDACVKVSIFFGYVLRKDGTWDVFANPRTRQGRKLAEALDEVLRSR